MDKPTGVSLIVIGGIITAASIAVYYASIPPDFPEMPMSSCACGIGPLVVLIGLIVLGVAAAKTRTPPPDSPDEQP